MKSSPVEYVLPEVEEMLTRWELIRAAISGQAAVKALGDKVLPRPNATDKSPENLARYDAYLRRAFWYGFSGRTLSGLTGYVFAKPPVIDLPSTLRPIENNVDGSGVTLVQQAKATLSRVIAYGRAGLLVDYPSTPEATTQQQLLNGNVSPTIVLYEPWQIRNWRISYIGAKAMLDMIVLREGYNEPSTDNEFESQQGVQYRVLTRAAGGVMGRIFREGSNGEFAEVTALRYLPKGRDGRPLTEITFKFVGATNNDSAIDVPPLGDLVDLNFAHFLSSAEHEDSCYMIGQPTPWVSGLSETWARDILGNTIQLGSRSVLRLPVGGAAGLLQAGENSMIRASLQDKEKMAVGLGAKLIEQKQVEQTATEAGLQHVSEVSTLTAAASNVFLAYQDALGMCSVYVGGQDAAVKFELSEPLTRDVVTPEQATALLALWQGGLVDFEEARKGLKKAGMAWKTDEEVQANNDAAGFGQVIEPPVV